MLTTLFSTAALLAPQGAPVPLVDEFRLRECGAVLRLDDGDRALTRAVRLSLEEPIRRASLGTERDALHLEAVVEDGDPETEFVEVYVFTFPERAVDASGAKEELEWIAPRLRTWLDQYGVSGTWKPRRARRANVGDFGGARLLYSVEGESRWEGEIRLAETAPRRVVLMSCGIGAEVDAEEDLIKRCAKALERGGREEPPRRDFAAQRWPGPPLRYELRWPAFGDTWTQRERLALVDGVNWLLAAQRDDGSWQGAQEESLEWPGVTALALLALMDARPQCDTALDGPIRRGIEALLAAQQRPGSGPPESVTLPGWIGVEYHAGTYNHLLALRALLTYRARYPDAHPDGLDEALRRALPLVLELRRPSGGFGYLKSTAPSNPYDSNLTLWSAWVLALGGEAGLLESDVVEPVLEGAARIVSDLTDPGTGRLGYGPREDQGGPGGPPSRFRETIDVYLPDATESLTAFAIYAERRFLPDTERQDEGAIRLGRLSEKRIERVLACRPVDGRAGYDLFSWYFGLLALGLVGGDEAAEWEAACFEQLVARQSRDEASRGAWPPDDAWGQTGGWVYSTAMAILCLAQTSWLHPPLRAPVAADEQ